MARISKRLRLTKATVIDGTLVPAEHYAGTEETRPSVNQAGRRHTTYSITVMEADTDGGVVKAVSRTVDVTGLVEDGTIVIE